MEKIFRTLTSGFGKSDDVIRLRLDITSSNRFIKRGGEVKAIVDDQTGEVKLFVDPDKLR
ncbi:TPA: hypothetical protein TUD09_001960 [Streptococcus equi subsp. zooepidemicus]|uniref:Uncharacterized protein n=1 Tax=Streptococcus equi subsp. ruminatorum CECT 5772 TaxID=1051981 RepID=A0A922NSF6_9STRE|nr:hypothetical protein [Streptococcus equi]KED03708.1 hypothetical protein CECT5772_09382 [Streptococcus equi subsp. ruminatorum CECT 5772]HEL0247641.1 hypothetical protein [Streptococcus equi subsp. zooepidemicus]HEL1024652.1 hypothetical protein [Streptococcus equi subsp. ruminatorum CECT 5772]